jgi:hypothetical protein
MNYHFTICILLYAIDCAAATAQDEHATRKRLHTAPTAGRRAARKHSRIDKRQPFGTLDNGSLTINCASASAASDAGGSSDIDDEYEQPGEKNVNYLH